MMFINSWSRVGVVVATATLLLGGPALAGARHPIFKAVASGKSAPVAAAIKADPKAVKARDDNGLTPLHHAAREEKVPISVVKLLIDKGARVNARDWRGDTPLHLSARGCRSRLTRFLIEGGARVNARNRDGLTPLHEAVKCGCRNVALILIRKGASANTRDGQGRTPLHHAARDQQVSISVVSLLIRKGARVNARDRRGDTPLHLSVRRCRTQLTGVLIDEGARVNARNRAGLTPLHVTIECSGCPNMAWILLRYGASVNARDGHGRTPLHLAVQNGHSDLVEELLRREAKKDVRDKRGRTPLDLARALKFQSLVGLLVRWKPRPRPPRPVLVPSAVKKRSWTPTVKKRTWKPTKAQLEAARKIGQPVSLTNSIGMKFRLIPAGSFVMGSPPDEPERGNDEHQHRVVISRPFYVQTTEVTQAQYRAIMGKNPSAFNGCYRCPVEHVSWHDAREFIRRLNAREKTNKYRLPTEAEWEYACRAQTTTPFWFGRTISTNQANYNGDVYASGPQGVYRENTTRVASFSPNRWGLYDMHGNVSEWCQDWYGQDYHWPTRDPRGPSSGRGRVQRGGSWENAPSECRSAERQGEDPQECNQNTGFRVVRDL